MVIHATQSTFEYFFPAQKKTCRNRPCRTESKVRVTKSASNLREPIRLFENFFDFWSRKKKVRAAEVFFGEIFSLDQISKNFSKSRIGSLKFEALFVTRTLDSVRQPRFRQVFSKKNSVPKNPSKKVQRRIGHYGLFIPVTLKTYS